MSNRLTVIVAFLAVALLAACDAQYRDISSSPDQRAELGQVCEVASDLRDHGVALKLGHERKTKYISIWNPGFTGPEVTFLVVLKPGTKLRVLAVRECSNCLFDRMLEYQVEVSPEPPQFAGKPAYIRADSKAMPHVQCPSSNAA